MTKRRTRRSFTSIWLQVGKVGGMEKPSLARMACIVSVICAAASAAIGSPAATQFTTLVNFDNTDGAYPLMSLIQARDGNLYGTTQFGGAISAISLGTVFKITPSGTLTTLHSFNGGGDGETPSAGLVQGTDGNFYGTNNFGGPSFASCGIIDGCGTVFKITPSGTLTTLYFFGATDAAGYEPAAGLVEGNDGNFYGTTFAGGANNLGTVFKITPSGTLTTLHAFDGTDGEYPQAGLVQGTDGNFYGTTTGQGGQISTCNGCGTIFKITPSGTLTTLHSFDGTDGSNPVAGLVQGTDGNFYGTTNHGGNNSTCNGCGTIFKITPSGTLTSLHSFDGTDGREPFGGLVQATDGNFYGTTYGTYAGAANDEGTVFKITPSGKLTTLKSFDGTDGANPYGGLVQDTDGNFYGTTFSGGTNDLGTVFSLSVGLAPFPAVTLSPTGLSFGLQALGTTSPPQSATVTNSGNATLTISSIKISGAGSSDFAQTNNCGTVSAGSSCTIMATFTPSSKDLVTASISIYDNLPGSPQGISLTGNLPAPAPVVTLSPAGISFPNQYVGTSGLPQGVTLTNAGTAPLTITNVAASPSDFSLVNTCGSNVGEGISCTISVVFDPTASGTRNGTLTVTDSATNSPQTVPLTGQGEDFSLTNSSAATATVSPGQTANYAVTISPQGGFSQMIALSCSGAPALSTCSVSPSSMKLSGTSSVKATVTVTTVGSAMAMTQPIGFSPAGGTLDWRTALSGTLGLAMLASWFGFGRERRRRMAPYAYTLLLLLGGIIMPACGGGGNGNSGGSQTAAGSYTLLVTGTFTSGADTLTHTTKLTLIVQ